MIKASHRISLTLLLLAAGPAAAQYTRPGELGEARVSVKDRISRAAQQTRWRLGPINLAPRLAVSDIGYVSNIYYASEQEAQSDLKAKGDAGLRAFFNLGPKVLVSPFADLTYSWWQDQENLRSWNESYGLQMFGDFNRLQLQLQAGRVEVQRNLNSEVQVPVDRRDDRLQFAFDVNFWGPLSLFGTVSESRLRYSGEAAEAQVPGLVLANLDSDGELLRGGLAYALSNGLRFGLGFEETQTDFLLDPGGRSNSGSGPLLTIGFEGSRLGVDIDLARRDIEFDGRQPGDNRRQTSGSGQLRWKFTERISTVLYGGIQLRSSALDSDAIFESRRTGINVRRDSGRRTRLGAFYEVGEDEYATVASDQVSRLDDLRSYGVNLQVQLGTRVSLVVGYVDSQRQSSDPAFDRDLRTLTARVGLGGDLLTW